MPEIYEKFINKYPIYKKEINYVGRQAKLTTILPGKVIYQSSRYPEFNEEWMWDGEFLIYVDGYVNTPNIAGIEEIFEFKFKPKKDTKITITKNEQVGADTIFID